MTAQARVDASVIIPTFGRRNVLLATLDALVQNRYPKNQWEIIVVDDGSADGTVEAVRAWANGQSVTVRCLTQANAGPARARNNGASVALGSVLIFIDNDIVVEPHFVERHVAVHGDTSVRIVTGRIRQGQKCRETPFGRYRDGLWEAFHDSHPPDAPSAAQGLSAANLSLTQDTFRTLGGFDENFTIASSEDWDLGQRAREAGFELLYDPLNVVVHDDWADDLPRFCERQRSYSQSDVLLVAKYGARSPRAPLVEAHSPVLPSDPLRRALKKRLTERLVAVGGEKMFIHGASLSERLFGDSRTTYRLYELAIACAIHDGVRRGLADNDPAATRVAP